jgi:hypothetical protein
MQKTSAHQEAISESLKASWLRRKEYILNISTVDQLRDEEKRLVETINVKQRRLDLVRAAIERKLALQNSDSMTENV